MYDGGDRRFEVQTVKFIRTFGIWLIKLQENLEFSDSGPKLFEAMRGAASKNLLPMGIGSVNLCLPVHSEEAISANLSCSFSLWGSDEHRCNECFCLFHGDIQASNATAAHQTRQHHRSRWFSSPPATSSMHDRAKPRPR